MKTRSTRVTTRRLCRALKISKTTAIRWSQQGAPHLVTPKGFRWDLAAVRAWRAANILPKPGAELVEGRLRLQNLRNEEREFRLAILKGECVLRTKVDKYMFASARQLRDAILGIPDRLCGILAAESDQHRCHALLTQEIRQALESLSHSDATWGDGAL